MATLKRSSKRLENQTAKLVIIYNSSNDVLTNTSVGCFLVHLSLPHKYSVGCFLGYLPLTDIYT